MAGRQIDIRMYKPGLGDCFLVTLPGESKPFHMLIDCGALKSRHYGAAEMRAVVQDILDHTGGRIDVLAATHEHWDHISGFVQAKEEFDQIKVDRVWVAWTEDPNSVAARLLKKEFKKAKKAVEAAVARMGPNPPPASRLGLYRQAISAVLEFEGGLGAASGADAWQYVLNKAPNVYCDPNRQPMQLAGVDGVRVYVLGPPDDPAYVRKLLSKAETYDVGHPSFVAFSSFAAAVADDKGAREQAFPFEERYRVDANKAKAQKFFCAHYGFGKRDSMKWRRIDDEWLSVAGELALHLDSHTNNTCLAIAIELVESGQVLLFPGDAQVGNWLSWGDLRWTVKDPSGKRRTVTIADLLARTVFYKVGHHGSHNATLRGKGLELMESPDLVAMIPVHRPTAQDQEWQFPYPPLLKRLKEKARGRVILADAAGIQEIYPDAKALLTKEEWQRFESATRFEDLYVEYRIDW